MEFYGIVWNCQKMSLKWGFLFGCSRNSRILQIDALNKFDSK